MSKLPIPWQPQVERLIRAARRDELTKAGTHTVTRLDFEGLKHDMFNEKFKCLGELDGQGATMYQLVGSNTYYIIEWEDGAC